MCKLNVGMLGYLTGKMTTLQVTGLKERMPMVINEIRENESISDTNQHY